MKPIISKQIRVRHPDHFVVGDDSVVDDFCYFSTRVRIGRCAHVAAGCTIGGGRDQQFEMGDFTSIGSGVRIWCTSDDLVNDLNVLLPAGIPQYKTNLMRGDVILEDYTVVGTNSVVMPANRLPVGVTVGALSFVPHSFDFEPWTVYAGIPIRPIKPRNREQILEQVAYLERMLKERTEG